MLDEFPELERESAFKCRPLDDRNSDSACVPKRLSVGPDADGRYIRLEVAARCPFIVFPVEAKAPTGRISAALLEKMHRVDNAAECK